MSTIVQFFIALVVLLALIGGGAWAFRRFGSGRAGSGANRARAPRLAIIDATDVMDRRKLVLVRRDNIEHLLLIGGPTDIVVEQNIVRASPQREQPPQRSPLGTEAPGRAAIPDLGTWNDTDAGAPEPFEVAPPPAPELPPLRPARPPLGEDMRRPAFPERRPSEPLGGFPAEPPFRNEPARPEPPRMEPAPRPVRPEPAREPMMPRASRPSLDSTPRPPRLSERPAPAAPPAAPPAPPSADQNLAEMAQRLEAALRRPGGGDNVEAVAPPVAPDAPARAPAPNKGAFENLEDEMASLLGRAKPPA